MNMVATDSLQIDVVVPTYNRLWALPRVIEFYLSRLEVARVIVVDDCSSDGTLAWLSDISRNQPKVIVVRHKTNRGASSSRNSGASCAKAPFVFFADDDMVLCPEDGLLQMVGELELRRADIATPIHILPEPHNEPLILPVVSKSSSGSHSIFHRNTLELHSRALVARRRYPMSFDSPLACGLMLMRRKVLDVVHYDEDLGSTSYRDETDFQLKALEAGFRMIGCSRPVLIDLVRADDKGGCRSRSNLITYELQAIRNNWRVLKRHDRVIHGCLGIRAPIALMQLQFIGKHLFGRVVRHYIGRVLRAVGILRSPA